MGKTIWHRRRAAATEAGRLHADGGPDRRHEFASMGTDVRDAYDAGYRNHIRELEEAAERERHPLRLIAVRARNIAHTFCDGDNPTQTITDLADMIVEIADYIRDQENGL